MFATAVKKVFGSRNQRLLKDMDKTVRSINDLEPGVAALSDAELSSKTQEFRQRFADGESDQALLPESFAVVREVAKRTLNMRHFDVQLVGGMVLHQGKIAEMRTGEGKTLVATLPVYLNVICGKTVHVVTVNDYLASRDAEWMGKIYEFLGLTVGTAVSGQDPKAKREAYACDVVYGTNNEYGFDYLRDNMAFSADDKVQRQLHFGIVDEVDSILIDEARTPLIISGPAEDSTELYAKINKLIPDLVRQQEEDGPGDFSVDEKARQVFLTEEGHDRAEELLAAAGLLPEEAGLYDVGNIMLLHHLYAGLRAHSLFQRDVDYIVRDNQIVIIDEFTGRMMAGRRWSEGLHQAVEAKEGVVIQHENQTLASITFQNLFRLYDKLSGMTGTADTEAAEFQEIYQLEVVVVPTHMTMIRDDRADLVYRTQGEKFQAIVDGIRECTQQQQPVLVGTASIETSEFLSKRLQQESIPHEVLNAKHHEREANIISQAGRPGAVTIATNMAGRGTDIVLGGSLDETDQDISEWEARHNQVIDAGGLCIIGTERHEARRIDNQLRGRAGRQGDPGETRFFVALDDDLVRRFGGDKIQSIMSWAGMDEDTPIENNMISKSIENAQVKVEAYHFDMRKHLVEYDDVVNTHRDVIYTQRDKVIDGVDLSNQIKDMIVSECEAIVFDCMSGSVSENWDVPRMLSELGGLIPLAETLQIEESVASSGPDKYLDDILTHIDGIYESFEGTLGPDNCREIERFLMLRSIDTNWVQHLTSMENLRQGIGLQAVGQRDPLVMYRKEGHEMFQGLQQRIQDDVSHTIFRTGEMPLNMNSNHSKSSPKRGRRQSEMATAPRSNGAKRTGAKVGRNQQCPCGSGKKFKRCCGLAA